MLLLFIVSDVDLNNNKKLPPSEGGHHVSVVPVVVVVVVVVRRVDVVTWRHGGERMKSVCAGCHVCKQCCVCRAQPPWV